MGRPDSVIKVCKGVRLNSKYEHSIYFPTIQAQREYFAGKVVKTFSAYSYYRRFWELKVDASIDEAKTWNYLFLTNSLNPTDYEYYFINRVEYKNESTVVLHLELDVIQTYLFRNDVQLLPCFVERQHVADDTVGANTVQEGLDVGEYVDLVREDFNDLKTLGIYAMSTVNLETMGGVRGKMMNGTFQRCGTYMCKNTDYPKIETLFRWMEANCAENLEGIMSMWMFPECFCMPFNDADKIEQSPFCTVMSIKDKEDVGDYVPSNPTYSIQRPTTLDGGYVPRNNKLYTYPYNFVYASNNNGGAAVFRYELFEDRSKADFIARGAVSPDGGVKLIPLSYRGTDENADHSLTLSGYPMCAWSSDEYKIWLAQNMNQQNATMDHIKVNSAIQVGGGLLSAVAGLATMNPMMIAGGLGTAFHGGLSGYQQIEQIMAQRADMAIQPHQAKGTTSSNVNIVNDCMTFSFYTRCVKEEFARQIDDFFTMYGYRINRVQTPDIHARKRFTYVKTVGCHVSGNLNNEDMVRIESIFDTGITFWTNGDDLCNYAAANPTL